MNEFKKKAISMEITGSNTNTLDTDTIICSQCAVLDRRLFSFTGIGNPKGFSVVVRYQHDINNLRDMVKSTLKGYDLYG